MSDDAPEPEAAPDVMLLHAPTDDGVGAKVIRAREGRVELGEVRPLAEGRPIHGEVLSLTPREGAPRVCDVKVHVKAPTATGETPQAHKGPARVASAAYRDGWERLFGGRREGGAPN